MVVSCNEIIQSSVSLERLGDSSSRAEKGRHFSTQEAFEGLSEFLFLAQHHITSARGTAVLPN